MELKNGMKVIAPSGCASYLTEGKEYEVLNLKYVGKDEHLFSFDIISDIGDTSICLLNKCPHLNDQNWIIKQETKENTKPSINIGYEFQLLIDVFDITYNTLAKKKVKRIYNKLKQLAKDNPNDFNLGAEVRKLL